MCEEKVLTAITCGELSEDDPTVMEWSLLGPEGEIEIEYICVDDGNLGRFSQTIGVGENAKGSERPMTAKGYKAPRWLVDSLPRFGDSDE